jgi:glycosyltransferase involved in cell wall biosynthesis
MVLLLGRLAPYKGLDLLYAAAPIVAAQIPKVQFVIAGRPLVGYRVPEPPPLPNGGTVRVIAEHVDVRTLARLYEQARVVVCPYAEGTQSGVILTAYAFGKPVVATAVGGLVEYVQPEKTGLLVPPGEPLALANAIVRILSDQVLYSQLCSGIQDFARLDNAWERLALRTLQVYKEAMEPGA